MNIQGASLEKVGINGDGSDSQIAILGSLNGATNIWLMSDLDSASKAYVRAWMQSHPGQVVDQSSKAGTGTSTPAPKPVSWDKALDVVQNISPPMAVFAETRAYLLKLRNWQAVQINGGMNVYYAWDGGLVTADGKAVTGYGPNSVPGVARPGGSVQPNTSFQPTVPTTTGGNSMDFNTKDKLVFDAAWVAAFGHLPRAEEYTYWGAKGLEAALTYAWCNGNTALLKTANIAVPAAIASQFAAATGTVIGQEIGLTAGNIQAAVTQLQNASKATSDAALLAIKSAGDAASGTLTDVLNKARANLGGMADATVAQLTAAATAASKAAIAAIEAAATKVEDRLKAVVAAPAEAAVDGIMPFVMLLGLGAIAVLALNGKDKNRYLY